MKKGRAGARNLENRTELLGAHCRPAEAGRIRRAASQAGQRLSEFLRAAALKRAAELEEQGTLK